jgi:hypothetical protein
MTRTVSTTWTRGRKTVTAGDPLVVKRLPGQARFRQHVRLDDGREWIDVVHPVYGFYSVRPDRVGPIPRKSTLRPVGARPEVVAA